MTTIYSNVSALSTLREINSALETTSERIATSRRINTASDGAALWAIARTLENDISMSSTITEQLGVADATLSAASAGLTSANGTLQDIRDNLVLARANGADRATLQTEIDGLISTLQATATQADVGNVEILNQSASGSYQAVKSFVANVHSSGGSTTVSEIDLDVRGVALLNANADVGILEESRTVNGTTSTVLAIDVSALTDAAGDIQTIDDLIAIVDAAMSDVTDAGAMVGAAINQVESHGAMVSAMASAREEALNTLVGADLEAEAAKQEALLVRQQLAIEALAISNSSLSTMLQLFR
ncbi:flagellin [Acuticoccus sp. I52.16.1]|uniref:flagellin N-terminal helical domain-containing protein n=1 Tax=Acuticoccus sp. I52.16.1 TaxID=2928472 RepID=UPI001FD25099|nr:flagellin [Acuticoccus sp. I52.16.1]UOM34294.1 hypothetical protein MRB58_21110 [Acuticoccus sp. I52.16.1]